MHIYFNNDVAFPLASLLRSRGHDVTTTQEIGRRQARDHLQLLLAAHNSWLLVTHNRRDYLLPHDAWRLWSEHWQIAPKHAGIAILPQNRQLTTRQKFHQLDVLFASDYPLVNELYHWQALGGWTRRPYFGVAQALTGMTNG